MANKSDYQISQDSLDEILHQVFHPSIEDAKLRDQMMREIAESMTIKNDGTKVIVTHSNLDLSFLDDIHSNLEKI